MLSGWMVPSSVSCFASLTWGERGPAHLGRRPEAVGLKKAAPRAVMVPGSWSHTTASGQEQHGQHAVDPKRNCTLLIFVLSHHSM